MRMVVASGGNVPLKRGQASTVANQRENVRVAACVLAPLARKYSLVITHGAAHRWDF